MDTLCSPYMEGRGYVNSGDLKAANFIANEFLKLHLKPVLPSSGNSKVDSFSSFLQPFPISVNTFPGKIKLSLNDSVLTPGKDFLVSSSSPSVTGEFPVVANLENPHSTKNSFLIITKEYWKKESKNLLAKKGYAGILVQTGKIPWDVSGETDEFPVIFLFGEVTIPENARISVEIENKYYKKYTAHNIIGLVTGNSKKDSLIVVTAHYDHLGRMGSDTYFPGANDNASGVTLLLCLADYFSKKKELLSYSMLFICFSGEEAGLVGSTYFTENSPIDLNKIRLLINIDLVGYGQEGMMIQNAPSYPKEFAQMDSINNVNKFLVTLKKRGNAPNSDHYPFTMKGVPAFFIYTLGGNKAYHDVFDKPENISLEYFSGVFNLMRIFIERL
ncbi:MAG: hypothetical protein A3H98_06365 [Bacteroidetes bacterium RIFCSPLOWO2_02_FULL_36_8]|nr:MAG: hypothetical protein A3H98_06365 [Bacteroidetes bacterium RIFCSPLOWO2_02_FULL_36_8]OFY71207.1 MAG: hypothetical protein A3G23_10480 [Bacteroidetes bacterium RIFCSPLOWO2_12_FULL_37_12]